MGMLKRTQMESWQSLAKYAKKIHLLNLQDIKSSRNNNSLYTQSACNLEIDFQNQKIDDVALGLLLQLAEECQLDTKIQGLFSGAFVNKSEQRPALHSALRQLDSQPVYVNGSNIIPEIESVRAQMQAIAEQLRSGDWYGFSGKRIKDIVNIGIGGSDLGPRLCISALQKDCHPDMDYHFITSVDPYDFNKVVQRLQPETTLFIISSKSFTTQETLENARRAVQWLGLNKVHEQHFIAVTANIAKAQQLGFKNCLRIWDWVGGRYSFCSAINLISMVAFGYEAFMQLLSGAHNLDNHFKTNDFGSNVPVLLALAGIWNNNFLGITNFLMLAYAQQLEYFVPYVQQLDMESNGKSVSNAGLAVDYATGPVVWGGLGNQAQHSYFQLLCQGTHEITGDFLGCKSYTDEMINHFMTAKLQVLTEGVRHDQINQMIAGNKPFNLINIDSFTPANLGALVALYEHKIFTQSVIWDINPFDQPGVESAKRNFLKNQALVVEDKMMVY